MIVCAGAYGSPELLLRSGIGPEPVLGPLGVDPVSVLPGVGANLAGPPLVPAQRGRHRPGADRGAAGQRRAAAVRAGVPRDSRRSGDSEPGEHPEAEIFPWQTAPLRPRSPPTRVSFTAALMAPRSRGRFELGPDGPRLRRATWPRTRTPRNMAEIVATTAELLEALAKDGVLTIPDGPGGRADDLVAAAPARR